VSARRHEKRAVLRVESAGREHAHRTGEVHVALRHHHLHAGMRAVGRAEDGLAFVRLVDPVLLGDRHHREQLAVVGIEQATSSPSESPRRSSRRRTA
jgi:hypothetical protein